MSIRLVVWDWNGTLFDDTSVLVAAVNESVVPMLGLAPMTVARYQEIFEVPVINIYTGIGVSHDEFIEKSEKISHAFHDSYEPKAARAHLRAGSTETLKDLATRGVSSVILSNHTITGIKSQLARLDVAHYFETVLANVNRDDSHHAGKQHRLEAYLANNHFQPTEVIIIGDTKEEVEIGKNLGLHTVAITGGCSSQERLEAASPDKLISSLHQLVAVVEDLA